MNKTNVVIKNNEFTSVMNTHLQGKINFARLTLISHFVIALLPAYLAINLDPIDALKYK